MRICEISHFFCYAAYREKAAAMARLTGEKEMLLTPAGWTEDYHGGQIEPNSSDEYVLHERRAYLNWKIWGGKRFQLFVLSPRIVRDIGEYEPDIIIVDSEPFGLLAFEVAVLRRLFFPASRLVVHSSQNLYKRYPFPFSATEAYVMREATVMFARTGDAKQVLIRKGYDRLIHVIPHGVDADHFSPAKGNGVAIRSDHSPFRIGFVGALAEHKGVQTLIEAVSGLNLQFELTVVGDGPQRADFESQVARSPMSSQIRFHDSVPNRHLPNMLRSFDVLIQPSITMSNWKEQFGRVMIEAMACGVPVVGSTSGSIPEVIGDGGLVFEEGNAVDLTRVLSGLARDREMLSELSAKARQRVLDHYSWRCIAERAYGFFSGLAPEDTGRPEE